MDGLLGFYFVSVLVVGFFFPLKNQEAIEFPDYLKIPFERTSAISFIMESDPGSTKKCRQQGIMLTLD